MINQAQATLTIRDLSVHITTGRGILRAVDGINLTLTRGHTLALVGESGSGKSLTSLAILGLLPKGARIQSGALHFRAHENQTLDLAALPEPHLAQIRGNSISMIFQEPMTSLNPVHSVGAQIAEVFRLHRGLNRRAARLAAIEALGRVEIPDAARRVDDYPHHMSGGMRQRVMIAMALACNPALLIADEPTTALDVTVQAQILDLLRRLQAETGMSILFITHNFGVVAQVAERVAVMRRGLIVEEASAEALFQNPSHDYTRELLNNLPSRLPRREKLRQAVGESL